VHPAVARRRAQLRRGRWLVATVVVATIASRTPLVAAIGVPAAVGLSWWWGAAWFRRLRHGFDDRQAADGGPPVIVVEQGVVAWHRRIVPAMRVQSISVQQSPFQRRAAVADLRLDLASAPAVVLRDVSFDQIAAIAAVLDRVPTPPTMRR
jgi:uncharacterized membrane protein YdbT with pleckstrin-like domain